MVTRTTTYTDQKQEFLTSSQAAKLIGVHPNTLRGYADQNLVPHVRLPGGHRRFQQSDVKSFIARLTDHTISEPTEDQMARLSREYGQ
jgi:excisionase family DNA binding protein